MNLYVGNLPFSYDSASLSTLFARFGEVASAQVVTDRDTGRSRGFGFVEMADEDARRAIEELDGSDIDGRRLTVNQARPRGEPRPASRRQIERPLALVSSEDHYVRMRGTVAGVDRNATFRVRIEGGLIVTAKAAGRMRRGRGIRIIEGDEVDVEVSVYDPTKGRIVWRYT